jgi:hypothetical protein
MTLSVSFASVEVLTAVLKKIAAFWGMPSCRVLHSCKRFGGDYCLILQDYSEDEPSRIIRSLVPI